MASVAAELSRVGVRVLTGTASELTYISTAGRPVTVDIGRFHQLPSSLPLAQHGRRTLVVADLATPRAIQHARERGDVDLIIQTPHLVVLSGRTYIGERESASSSHPDYNRGALERVLVLTPDVMSQAELGAAAGGITQQAVSHLTRRYRLPAPPLNAAQRRELLGEALTQHPPTEETYWYGLEPLSEQVRAVIDYAHELEVPALAGGEIAADRMRPWRIPSTAVVYTNELLDLTDADLVPAPSAEESTLTLRVSDDPTVIATGQWWNSINDTTGPVTVDPVIVLRDLRSRLADDGAVEELRDWICRGPHPIDRTG